MKSKVIYDIKQELKSLAASVRENRTKGRSLISQSCKNPVTLKGYKDVEYKTPDPKLWQEGYSTLGKATEASSIFRHNHIAYCLLRGKTMEQIEKPGKKPRCSNERCYCCNKPDMSIVYSILNDYKKKLEEESKENESEENEAVHSDS